MTATPVLKIKNLRVAYGDVEVLLGASVNVAAGEVLGLVGESGSGKSTLVQGALRVLPAPAVITGGAVELGGRDVLAMDADALRKLWWEDVSIVPQNALSALNPMLTIADHFDETLRAHGVADPAERHRRSVEGMALVDLDPVQLGAHPHMLSGGMRQRVAIGLALVLDPQVVVFDEPTTALDVVLERDIIDRIVALQRARGFAAVFITHDVSLLMSFADRVAVMYAGRVVEVAPVAALGGPHSHPYTVGLLGALPPVLGEVRVAKAIAGVPPRAGEVMEGCRFAPRCTLAMPTCAVAPTLDRVGPDHAVACHRGSDGEVAR